MDDKHVVFCKINGRWCCVSGLEHTKAECEALARQLDTLADYEWMITPYDPDTVRSMLLLLNGR